MDERASNELAVSYEVDGAELTITPEDVRGVLCDNPNVTLKEVRLFLELCRAHKLNPFVKDAYLIKYGDNPATIVTGKDVFTKRAQRNQRFRGIQAGITVIGTDGALHRREGSMLLQGEQLVGGWCKVYVAGYEHPMYDEVSFAEYAGKRKDGSLNQQWASKPGTMIRKVAVVHALREAFPEEFAGLYDAAEMGDVEPQYGYREIGEDEITGDPSEVVPLEVIDNVEMEEF